MSEKQTSWQPVRQILDKQAFDATLNNLAEQIFRDFSQEEELVFMGMARKGIPIAKSLASLLKEKGMSCLEGEMDATFYRDDYHYRDPLKNPEIVVHAFPYSLDGKTVIIVDDVLYTGRSVRAALHALSDFGRPAKVALAVLVDRGGREMPIAADYIGCMVQTDEKQEVLVNFAEEVLLMEKKS